jgi:hypothetical protein
LQAGRVDQLGDDAAHRGRDERTADPVEKGERDQQPRACAGEHGDSNPGLGEPGAGVGDAQQDIASVPVSKAAAEDPQDDRRGELGGQHQAHIAR